MSSVGIRFLCIVVNVILCFDALWTIDTVSQKLRNNNIFTVAKRNVEGQDMLYQSLKLTNGIWVLAELKIQPGNPNFTVSSLTLNWLHMFSFVLLS